MPTHVQRAPRLQTGLLLTLVTVCCGLVGSCVVVLVQQPDPRPAPTPTTASAPPAAVESLASVPTPPREVLRSWDASRSAAWTAGNPTRLAALYTPGSVAGLRDVRRLRAWVGRSISITRLEAQVLALTVMSESSDRLVLRVTDRVVVRARGAEGPVELPDDRPTTRLLELRLTSPGRWLMAAVSEV